MNYSLRSLLSLTLAAFSLSIITGCGGDTPDTKPADSATGKAGSASTAASASSSSTTGGSAGTESGAAPSSSGVVTSSPGDTSQRAAATVQSVPLAPDPTSKVARPQLLQSKAESGSVTYKGKVGTDEMSTTLYFKNRGETRAAWNTYHTTQAGKEYTVENVSLTTEGTSTLWDPKKKVGTRSPMVPGGYTPNFATMSAEQKTAYGYRTLPAKTILGHSCEGHSVVINGIRTNIWVWEGIPLRTETGDETSVALSMEATAIDLTTPVPDEKFAIPSDVKISSLAGATTGDK